MRIHSHEYGVIPHIISAQDPLSFKHSKTAYLVTDLELCLYARGDVVVDDPSVLAPRHDVRVGHVERHARYFARAAPHAFVQLQELGVPNVDSAQSPARSHISAVFVCVCGV